MVELLLSIAVVAALTALAFSVAGRLQEQGKVVRCVAQQKQIGSALHLYAGEHGGNFPPFIQGKETLNSTGSQNTLAAHLVPPKGQYLPDKTIFQDPGAINRIYRENANGWVNWTYTGETERSGYWHVYMSPRSVHNPQRADEDQFGANDTVRCPPYRVLLYCYYTSTDITRGAHPRGEVNVLRIDGSVETFSRSRYQPGKGIKDNFGHKRL